MKKNIKVIYRFEIVILLLDILLFFIKSINNKHIISIIVLGILLFVSTLVYKKKKDSNIFRGSATRIMIAVIIFYFIISILLGMYIGFSKTLFSPDPRMWVTGLIPILIVTIISENLKYILIKNNLTNKKAIYFLTALLTVLNIVVITNIASLNTLYKLFVFMCVTLMTITAQEMLSTYMICNYGFLPAIAFKLIMNLYVYIVPVMPNLGDYLYSAINLFLPFTIYMVLEKYLKPKEIKKEKIDKLVGINLSFITIPIIIFLIIIIILVSGIFKHQMIAIASNSMVPIYERGDAIIFDKIKNKKVIREGDIIVFIKDNKLIAHRVTRTKEYSEKKYFYTKGDANQSEDIDMVKEEEVLGVVERVVKYIGYPTVLINELFGGE